MNSGFKFSYWIGKVITLGVFLAPVLNAWLPVGWENITLGLALHGVADYLNQRYHVQG